MRQIHRLLVLGIASVLMTVGPAFAETLHVPATISTEARAALEAMGPGFKAVQLPAPDQTDAWKEVQAGFEKDNAKWLQFYTEKYRCHSQTLTLGKVPVFQITPPGYAPAPSGDTATPSGAPILVYLHGGGYALLSPYSNLSLTFPLAAESGLTILAVDYTLAPEADWHRITDEIVSVFETLYGSGCAPSRIGVYGDSAGGSLTAGVLLKMRSRGLPLPGAAVLISPWSDITRTGDSYFTLEEEDPFLAYNLSIQNAAAAYAPEADQKNPVVSPVYGDYTRGFVPTLIQGGTKEIFLSNCVRLYQAMDQAGVDVTLDLYEGMWHDFIARDNLPESKTARGKIIAFFKDHLSPDNSGGD